MSSRIISSNRSANFSHFFSICIPQYNRTDFLIKSCQKFASQKFRSFEICISDDCSDDKKRDDLLKCLESSGLTFTYAQNLKNLRYDGNLRNAISLSTGQYILLMGNDDGLSDCSVLQTTHDHLISFSPIAVAIANYRELPSGRIYRRVTATRVLGAGPRLAAKTFRCYSFVSGVVLKGDCARKHATAAYDGSEMYQMYLASRLVAAGGRLLTIDRVLVDKDLQVPGQMVDSYRLKPKLKPCPIVERTLPMSRLLEVVAGGLQPHHFGKERRRNLISAAKQLYRYTYPFWIVEYRRVQSWRYAFGVYLGLKPSRIAKDLSCSWLAVVRLWAMYFTCGAAALTVPIALFDAVRPMLYALAKRLGRA